MVTKISKFLSTYNLLGSYMRNNRLNGCFLSILAIGALSMMSALYGQNALTLNIDQATYTINKELYGGLMENWGRGIYTGVYVGESSSIPNTKGIRNDVISAFKDAGVTNLCWPGGCFAETYDWREGIGPKAKRDGGEMRNGLGTDEYFELCELLGTIPYITANISSRSPAVMTGWLNHIDSLFPNKLKYWKMGNEIWGGCGNGKSVSQYISLYDQYKVAIPSKFSGKLFRIADGGSGNGLSFSWLESVMQKEVGSVEGVTFHYYAGLNNSGPSYNFNEADYYKRLGLAWAIESHMNKCEGIMIKYDPDYTVGLMVDEWGAWYTGIQGMGNSYQQSTCRDAVIASMHLNVFNNHCRRVKMASVAQPVNVIQSLLLTKNPPTTDIIKTPTFYVFKMYKVHQNAKMVPLTLTTNNNQGVPLINASASVDSAGKLHISMCNTHATANQNCAITLKNAPSSYATCTGTIINGPKYNSFNDYGHVEPVNIQNFDATNFSLSGTTLTVTVPAHSVITLELSPVPVNISHKMEQNSGVWSATPLQGGAIRLQGSGFKGTSVSLTLFGVDGRTVVASDFVSMESGKSVQWMPNKNTGAGVYIVKITAGERVSTHRLFLSR